MEPFLQIAPHSLAIVLSRVVAEDAPGVTESEEPPHHHTGYEIFADFKSLNMKYFWNKMVADAIAETFFLGWIDEHVLLIQGKEDHLEVLREAWMRRSLKPPQGFDIKYLVSPTEQAKNQRQQWEGTNHACMGTDLLRISVIGCLVDEAFTGESLVDTNLC
ncbi:storkhead-box protein [Pimephales promelas]|nr:storkhead-box protein [Pimephales promelas]